MQQQEQQESDIRAVLTWFGKASPREGMENRLLRQVQTAVSAEAKQTRFFLRFATLAGIALIAAICMVWTSSRRNQRLVSLATNATPPGVAQPLGKNHVALAKPVPYKLSNTSSNPPQTWGGAGKDGGGHLNHDQYGQSPNTSDAASEAPSMPAPPLPLTGQEKLLLAAAQGRSSQTQLAELRRPVWPLRDPADDEDFRKFFDSQTSLINEGENE